MSAYEVEIKAWCEDQAAFRRTLASRGALLRHRLREIDSYYNHPSRDFGTTDEALRIRMVDDGSGREWRLTYKGPKVSGRSKTRVEEELVIADGDAMGRVLAQLGFRLFGTVEKEREYWELGEVHLCLDQVPGIGEFVELERQGEDWPLIEEGLLALARELGLSRLEKRSYLELKYGGRDRSEP